MRDEVLFHREPPLLFAHRGGALEAPESTKKAFENARSCRADVLEFDVQTTIDGHFVVWHGPELYNVLLHDDLPRWGSIGEYNWPNELEKGAWVAPPGWKGRIEDIPRSDDVRIMLLEELLWDFKDMPLNIEIKKDTFLKKDGLGPDGKVKALLKLLAEHAEPIVISSQSRQLLRLVQEHSRYPTGLSTWRALGVLLGLDIDVDKRAYQVPWFPLATPRKLIRRIKEEGGAVHVFITGPVALDRKEGSPEKETLFRLLDRGVDGVMTDRPSRVRHLIDQWRAAS